MTSPIPSTLASSRAWRHVHIGQPAKYIDQEVEDVVAAVKGHRFKAADSPWLKILVPGEAYAVYITGQPMLKVGCLDERGVAGLLGDEGVTLHQHTMRLLQGRACNVGNGQQRLV
jgi:hypothetical protein